MELSKKTTILFTPDLHARLSRLAGETGTSLGELVRSACERQYSRASKGERLAAVERLASMRLPVGPVRRMKRESIVRAEDLLP